MNIFVCYNSCSMCSHTFAVQKYKKKMTYARNQYYFFIICQKRPKMIPQNRFSFSFPNGGAVQAMQV